MPDAPWASLTMQAAFYLVTAAALIATMRQIVKGLQDAVNELKTWAAGMETFRREAVASAGVLAQRIETMERDEGLLQKLNDAVVRLDVRFEHLEKSSEKQARELAGVQRALANIASGQTSITKMEGDR
ncbi:hypothetical protein [Phenylobacterium sp.]|uniref:hypothetical protein n=1 Tax=Phenylobacterium sp. TaxID=1871053 RepID=UPI00395B841B